MQVPSRRGNVAMPQRRLHQRDRGVAVKAVAGMGMAEPVGASHCSQSSHQDRDLAQAPSFRLITPHAAICFVDAIFGRKTQAQCNMTRCHALTLMYALSVGSAIPTPRRRERKRVLRGRVCGRRENPARPVMERDRHEMHFPVDADVEFPAGRRGLQRTS